MTRNFGVKGQKLLTFSRDTALRELLCGEVSPSPDAAVPVSSDSFIISMCRRFVKSRVHRSVSVGCGVVKFIFSHVLLDIDEIP